MSGTYKIPGPLQPFIMDQAIIVRSPGRINLIGEHTDYNEGFVLPAAIDKAVYVVIEKNEGDTIVLHSTDFNETVEYTLAAIKPVAGHWSTYILGVADQLQQRLYAISGFKLAVYGDVPLGAGLSSSAAIECATAFALNELFGLGITRKELSLIAQKAEHEFAGVKCGIMDQFASLFGKKNNVIRLDCRSLDYEYFPLELGQYKLVLLDSQVKHSLASTEYNVRRSQCEAGVSAIQQQYPGIKSLRDVTMEMINACIDPADMAYRRCKYVVEENTRLQEGCIDLLNGNVEAFGKKMFATHAGLSKEYEVSCKELDYLVERVQHTPFVIGARMMGGGFGGCTINIMQKEEADALIEKITVQYKDTFQMDLKSYTVQIEEGTSVIR